MNNNHNNLQFVRYLLSRSLEGTITQEQMQQLDRLILEDAAARRYYAEFLHVHVSLRKLLQKEIVTLQAERDDVLDVGLWEELARHEQMAETVMVQRETVPEPLPAAGTKSTVSVQPRKLSKFSLFSVAASIAAALFVVLYIHLVSPAMPVVATLSDAIDAQWSDPHAVLDAGDDVRAERYRLQSGIISLRFESGAEVVIEGPAEFCPQTVNQMTLIGGKAFAQVPETAIGFTIDTPGSSVVDLGTAFGVAVNPDGGSDVHVYQGKVNLVAGLADQPKKSEILHEYEARHVDAERSEIRSADFKEYLFAQQISSKDNRILYGRPISLASLVAGGDGYSPGDQPTGIDPQNGQVHETAEQDFDRLGTGTYNPVKERPFIDGVFVPNGASVVSSDGHVFEAFPVTSGSYWSDITTSPILKHIALDDDGQVLYRQQLVATLDTAEQDDNAGKPKILLHANAGVTFDLNKIRARLEDDTEIVALTARCGTSKNVLAKMKHAFWVLLDGERVFYLPRDAGVTAVAAIRIPIPADRSYLTLAVTDGGDSTSFDWCLFEEPELEIKPRTGR